jgi:hypothetical protein
MSNDFSLAGYQPEQYNDEGPRYPLIYWLNTTKLGGVVGAWHTGDFATLPEPWNRVERFDNEEHGHETTSLTFVPLRMRQQWYMNLTTMQGDTVTKAIPHYMDGVAARTFLEKHGGGMHLGVRSSSQVLAMVQGIDEPVVVQTKGLVAMATFKRPTKRSPGGDVYQLINAMLGVANQTRKGSDQIPHFAFWVTLKQPLTPKGKVQSVEVGGGAVVVYPQLDTKPDSVTRDMLVQRFIGREKLQLAHAMYLDSEAWANEPPRNDFIGEEAAPPPPARPVNVPQPIGDEDSPF